MGGGSRTRSFIIPFFISTLAFSLTSAGILKGNMDISMDDYATKSEGKDGGSSGGSGSDGGGSSNDEDRGGSSGGSDNIGGSTGGDNNLKQRSQLRHLRQ
jgi:hypothetical protein